MNHETQQPYFTIRVTRCWECPHFYNEGEGYFYCEIYHGVSGCDARKTAQENIDGITPSCPMWAQVQQEKKDAL